MTNKDLYRALSDVDTGMVLDAQPGPKRSRPVWARAVAITACACLTVGVLVTLPFISKWAAPDTPDVPGEAVTPEQTEQQTEAPTAGQVIENPIEGPVFLFHSSLTGESDASITKNFSSSSEYGLDTVDTKEVDNDLTSNTKSSPITGNSISYAHTKYKLKSNSTGEHGTFYSRYDVYTSNKDEYHYLPNSDQMVYYSTPYDSNLSYPEMTEEQVRAIGEKFILSHISQEDFSKYTFVSMSVDVLGIYNLMYVRYIGSYKTDEVIFVNVDRSGHISCFDARNLGKYDGLIAKIETKAVDQAYKELLDKIQSLNLKNCVIDSIPLAIVTSTTGDVYLRIGVKYDIYADTGCAELFYVSIELT